MSTIALSRTAVRQAGLDLWPSERWVAYFHRNDTRLMRIPWDRCELTSAEKAVIGDSIREFQLGESGEGRHFRKVAADWAQRCGDTAYPAALHLFIAEEQRHARDLGRFMDANGIARAESLVVNDIFKHLRRLAGLELIITVLVTAELVAQVYYRCLLNATASPALQALCRQILRDEVQHVRFQCQRLAVIRSHRFRIINAISVAAHAGLLLVTAAVVWRKHWPVLRCGGMGFTGFVRALFGKFRTAVSLMTPGQESASRAGRCGGNCRACAQRLCRQ